MKKQSRLLSLLLAFVLVFSVGTLASANGMPMKVSIGNASGEPGKTVSVDISLADVADCTGISDGLFNGNFTITYDSSALEIGTITKGELFSKEVDFSEPNTDILGEVTFLFLDDSAGDRLINIDGVLATVNFVIKEDAIPDDYTIGFAANPFKFNGLLIAGPYTQTTITADPIAGTITVIDNTPPAIAAGYPKLAETQPAAGSKQVKILAMFDEGGTMHYVTLPAGAAEPTGLQVKNHTDGVGNTALDYAELSYTANVEQLITTGPSTFADGTPYDFYVVVEDSSCNISGVAKLSITTPPAIPAVTSVAVNPSSATVVQGGSQQLTANVTAVGGASTVVTWNSDDLTDKVSVDANGLVNVAADATTGSYTITAISDFDTTQKGSAMITVVSPTTIDTSAISGVTPPARNAVAKTAITSTPQFTGTISWSPALTGGKFAASTIYTATITLTPTAGYTLIGVAENFFKVAGADPVTNDADSGVVKAVFPKTAATPSSSSPGGGGAVAPTVTGIEIKAAPDKVSYDEGDKLDLTGLEVTVTYSDGKTKDIAAEDFAKNGITVSPKAGEVLDADVTAIEIKADGKTVKQVIVVDKKDIVTPQDIDKPVEKPVLTDIDGHWAEDYIDYLVGIGAISGYPDGTFRPDAPITRAEFAKVIVDAFELKGSGKVFDDTADHWAKNYVAIAAANGIVLGYNENEFGPDDLITREQMAIIIVKAAGLKEQTGVLDFIDEGNVSSWAYNWVVSAVDNNLMSGYEDNSFKPLNNATRAEAATVIYNILMK